MRVKNSVSPHRICARHLRARCANEPETVQGCSTLGRLSGVSAKPQTWKRKARGKRKLQGEYLLLCRCSPIFFFFLCACISYHLLIFVGLLLYNIWQDIIIAQPFFVSPIQGRGLGADYGKSILFLTEKLIVNCNPLSFNSVWQFFPFIHLDSVNKSVYHLCCKFFWHSILLH